MLSLSYGQIIGRDHIQRQVNCQDGLAIREGWVGGQKFAVGVVTDGCGSGKHSEIGAQIFGQYVAELLYEYVDFLRFSPHCWSVVSANIYKNTVMQMQTRFPLPLSKYVIENYLLFTVIGFIACGENLYWLKKGDGRIVYRDSGGEMCDRDTEDYDNMPPYIAYELVDPNDLHMDFESGFKIGQEVLSEGSKFMISTDGLEEEFVDQVWEKPNRKLQRFLNVQSNKHKKLADDTSVIVVESELE